MEKRHLRNFAVLISMVILTCGCGYKFVKDTPHNIFIYPVTNYSFQPLADIYLTDALKDVFIEYPEYHPVNNEKSAEYTLKVNIKRWEREPMAFSGEKTREIVIARFSVVVEIILNKDGKTVFTDTLEEKIPVSLGGTFYKEEDIISEASKKLASKIYFYIVDKR